MGDDSGGYHLGDIDDGSSGGTDGEKRSCCSSWSCLLQWEGSRSGLFANTGVLKCKHGNIFSRRKDYLL